MEITWYGLSCFKLTERGAATVVTDPFDATQTGYRSLNLAADIVTISHSAPGHSFLDVVQGKPHIIDGPGEYEIGGVFVTGIQTGESKSEKALRNTLYVFDINSLTIAHLGDLDHIPTRSEIEAIGPLHIALIPVGGGNSLTAARAAEVITLLEPNIVVPMHYATPECTVPLEELGKFLKEMGISEIEKQPSLKITSSQLPEETQVIVLNHQGGLKE